MRQVGTYQGDNLDLVVTAIDGCEPMYYEL